MDKQLRRLLELSGQLGKNEIVKNLQESHGDSESLDHQGPLVGLEGPFTMKNGRVVYYNINEQKYYDRITEQYLNENEITALEDDTPFNNGVILHATRGEEKINLRLEGMMAMLPMATMLRRNGYGNFEMTGEDGERGSMPDMDDEDPDMDGEPDMDRAEPDMEPEPDTDVDMDDMDGGDSHDAKMDTLAAKAEELADLAKDVASDGEKEEEPEMDVEPDMEPEMEPDAEEPDLGDEMGDAEDDGPEMEMRDGRTEKRTPSLSKTWDKSNKRRLNVKDRQERRKDLTRFMGIKPISSMGLRREGEEGGIISSLIAENSPDGQWHSDTMKKLAGYSEDELKFVIKDAGEAGELADKMGNEEQSGKYADEIHYATMELRKRQQAAMGEGEEVDETTEHKKGSKHTSAWKPTSAEDKKSSNKGSRKDAKNVIRNDLKEEEELEERALSDDETAKLDRLKKKHEGGPMWKGIVDEYGEEKGKDVFYGKLTKMAKEGVEELEEEVTEDDVRKVMAQQKKEALAKYAKSKDAADATAARKTGATSAELQKAVDTKVEEAVDATFVDNSSMPANAVDDMVQKAERTGQADRVGTKNKTPAEVMTAINTRIKELEAAIDRYDEKGFNDGGVKPNAIEALEKIKEHLQKNDHEGFMAAQIYFTTLMSPIWDLLPAQMVNYLAKGSDSE